MLFRGLIPRELPALSGWSTVERLNYKCRFDWPQDSVLSARLVIGGMTQVIAATLNGRDLGLRFAYPFRFDLEGTLRPGSNDLELRHVERYSLKSRLGNIKFVPYYQFRI